MYVIKVKIASSSPSSLPHEIEVTVPGEPPPAFWGGQQSQVIPRSLRELPPVIRGAGADAACSSLWKVFPRSVASSELGPSLAAGISPAFSPAFLPAHRFVCAFFF